jgi:hypothetical protein
MSTLWMDRQGDVWTLGDDKVMRRQESTPDTWERVEREWGPLTLVHQPDGHCARDCYNPDDEWMACGFKFDRARFNAHDVRLDVVGVDALILWLQEARAYLALVVES